jgi:hypothetical protein
VSAEVPDVDPAVLRAEIEAPAPPEEEPPAEPISPRLEPVPEPTPPAERIEEPPAERVEEPPAAQVEPSEPPKEAEPSEPAPPPVSVEPAPPPVSVEPIGEPVPASPVLAIPELRLCRRVQGFGRFEAIDGEGLRPGQVVVLYCEMAGVRYEPHGEEFRSVIEAAVAIMPESSDAVLWQRTLGAAEDLCHRPRQDYYVNYRLTLPDAATLPPGPYRLRLTQRDRLAGTEAERVVSFRVSEPAR